MRRVELLAAILLSLGLTPSCRFFKRAPKTPPPVTTPPPAQPKAEAKPVVLPTPPAVAPTDTSVKAPPTAEVKVPPAPPKQTKRPPPPKVVARPSAVKPDPEPAEPPKTEAPVPPPAAQLGELISDRQRSELNRQIDQSLEKARQNLSRLASRAVTPAEAEARQRIESFIRQAEATRKDDPLTAKNLAERAEVLSQDLARN